MDSNQMSEIYILREGCLSFLFERDIITVSQYCWYYNQPGKVAHGKMIVSIQGIIRDPCCLSACLTTITKYLTMNDGQRKVYLLETNYISWLPQFILCWGSEVLGIMEKRISWQIKQKVDICQISSFKATFLENKSDSYKVHSFFLMVSM